MKMIPLAFLFLSFNVAAQTDCTLKLEKDSISVFTCRSDDSKYKIVKATFDLTARFDQLQQMILDIDHLGDWQYHTASARLIKTVAPNEIIYYTELNAPVINNRDVVIRLKIEKKASDKWLITAISQPGFVPQKKNVVRIPSSKATWNVKKKSSERLSVEYTIKIDFGGEVPPWVVNSLAHKAAYETFKRMKEQIGNYSSTRKK